MAKAKKRKQLVKRIAESPAIVLEKITETKTTEVVETLIVETAVQLEKPVKQAKQFWKALGPGLTTGAADDDPAGIATYSQTGAQFGNQLLWLSAFTFPLMAIVQEMCARIGIVTGRGLAANMRKYYSPWLLDLVTGLLFLANTLNIGANLGAMAKATQLLLPNLPFGGLVAGFALLSLGFQIFMSYARYARYLKWLTIVLLSYIATAFLINDFDWSAVLYAVTHPSITFSREQLFLICAILGTTISPYLFFWQTSQEVEEQVLEGKTTIAQRAAHTSLREIKRMRFDVWSGMLFSNIVMFFIIAVSAATLHQNGIVIGTAADAAMALRPLAGDGAYILFALGIIGTGLLAIPVLAGSSAYAIAESFGWRYGLNRKLKEAYAFYGVIIIAMLLGLGLNFLGIDPIKALIYSAVANGLVAPLVLIPIVQLSGNKKIMGRWVNLRAVQWIGWFVITIMVLAGIAAIWSLLG